MEREKLFKKLSTSKKELLKQISELEERQSQWEEKRQKYRTLILNYSEEKKTLTAQVNAYSKQCDELKIQLTNTKGQYESQVQLIIIIDLFMMLYFYVVT